MLQQFVWNTRIDHLTLNVENLEATARFFITDLGFTIKEYLDPSTEESGMISQVIERNNLTIALNQGTNAASQISESIQSYGEHIQHIALQPEKIPIRQFRDIFKKAGMQFMTPIFCEQREGEWLKQCFTKTSKAQRAPECMLFFSRVAETAGACPRDG